MMARSTGESKKPHLPELEFQELAIEGFEKIFCGSLDDRSADLIGVGALGIDEHDRLPPAPIGGPADPFDEFGRGHAAKPIAGDDDIGLVRTAMPEGRVRICGLGHLEAVGTKKVADSPPRKSVFIHEKTPGHAAQGLQLQRVSVIVQVMRRVLRWDG